MCPRRQGAARVRWCMKRSRPPSLTAFAESSFSQPLTRLAQLGADRMARMMEAMLRARGNGELGFHADTRPDELAGFSLRTVFQILASGACYYLATRTAWVLTFPDSKVSLFFFPHA